MARRSKPTGTRAAGRSRWAWGRGGCCPAAPQLRRLRRLASVVLAVFALYYLLGSATTSKYALLGMIAALLAIVLSYVLRLEPDGDDEPAA